MKDDIRFTCEPNEAQAFLDYQEANLAIQRQARNAPPIHPMCRCYITPPETEKKLQKWIQDNQAIWNTINRHLGL